MIADLAFSENRKSSFQRSSGMAFSSPAENRGEKAILSNRLGVDCRMELSGVQSPETTHEIGQNRSVENRLFFRDVCSHQFFSQENFLMSRRRLHQPSKNLAA